MQTLLNRIDQNKTSVEVLAIAQEVFDLIISEKKWIHDFFIHPLGFYYCRLFHDNNHQIRLHIWEPNYIVKKDHFIHDHFYDLCSWVLCGTITDYTYKVSITNEESDYCLFASSYIGDENIRTLKQTNNFLLVEKREEKIIKKSEKYIIPRDTFHSNIISFEESDLTVTFVYTFNHKEKHTPNVIGKRTSEVYYENNPIKISPEKIMEIIDKAKINIWG